MELTLFLMVITGFISHEKVFYHIITLLHFYYCFRIFATLVLLIQISDNFEGSFTIYQSRFNEQF